MNYKSILLKIGDTISQLWVGDNGKLSHAKFWNNIACGVATMIVIRLGEKITLEFFQWYLGLVGFQALASKFMTLKMGGTISPEAPPKTDAPTPSS